ncbi:Type I restriction-modification system, specificity subunit S (EC [uncultured Gammaproteobacteria bacterium]|nr:Type I restriction-modification system, specificity subunit S [uncultured Gammaproteobacteria bacterium]VVH57648.1 Type I restriction-modification system, specificity subunit S (EC [uncultured Gammaproteobacteria bacterium]
MKPYSSYKDSGIEWIGEIPSGWNTVRNKYLFDVIKTVVGEEHGKYQLLSLTKRGVVLRDIESGKGKFPESFDTYQTVNKDELIFCLYDIDETPRTVGISNYSGMISGSYKIVKCNTLTNPKFIYYNYLSIDDVKGLRPYYTGLRKVVRTETFLNLKVRVPPLQEQQQISDYLDYKISRIDTLLEKTQQKIELLKEQRTSLINTTVTKGLNPNVEMKDSGVEWIGEIPSGWNVKRLKYISKILPSNVNKHIFPEEIQVRLCNYTDVYYNELIDGNTQLSKGSCNQDEYNKFWLREGDVIITKDSETSDDIGIPTEVKEDLTDVVCGYHLTLIRPLDVVGSYIFRFIQSDRIRRYFEINSDGVTRFGLGKPTIQNMYLPIPPLQEQQKIVDYLDLETSKIDKLVENETKRIVLLKEYRQSLISEVVTGKVDVRDEVLV